jgi:hypothetical protein
LIARHLPRLWVQPHDIVHRDDDKLKERESPLPNWLAESEDSLWALPDAREAGHHTVVC